MELSHLGKTFLIGDSAATRHMTSNKMGVYNLVPINGSVMIGNGKSISCTHKGKLDVMCKLKDGSIARETWDVKIVPELNHDLFSFTKAMKNGWQMNGRWKEGGLKLLFLDEEERSLEDERSFGESSIEEIEEESESDGNNTETQKKLGIDINMIGAREENLRKTRSETKELSSPTNESM